MFSGFTHLQKKPFPFDAEKSPTKKIGGYSCSGTTSKWV